MVAAQHTRRTGAPGLAHLFQVHPRALSDAYTGTLPYLRFDAVCDSRIWVTLEDVVANGLPELPSEGGCSRCFVRLAAAKRGAEKRG
jgi:hypothetical protein